ncbi:MAG: diguanylate cyclase [Ruminococcaceae bacterium]|nr:diguanylate cyclase [Oscillospiraceae bacterium]
MKNKKGFFSSISRRLMLLIIIGIFCLATVLVTLSAILMSNTLTKDASSHMNLFCSEKGDDINKELIRIEDAVGSLSKWTYSKIPDLNSFKDDVKTRDAVIDDVDNLLTFMTEENDVIESVYIHYSIDITGAVDREEGVYYSRDANGKYKKIPFTQAEIPEDSSADYWYYGPIRNKKATWTKPYFDDSIGMYLISYVQPVFIDGTPVAVIGIDISFERLLSKLDTIRYNETGYVYLKEADGSVHYHPAFLKNENIHGDEMDELVENGELMKASVTGDKLIRYNFKDGDRVMAFTTLRNGMKLVLCDSYESIFDERNQLVNIMIIVTFALAVIFAAVAAIMANRITDPLRKITAAAHEISNGDYDVLLPPEKNNEVGELSKAFRLAIDKIRAREEDNKARAAAQDLRIEKAAEKMKQQQSDLVVMKNLAYSDSLTNVKNKTAYDDTTGYIDEQIKAGTAEFAVIMCDLNYLKIINDTRGHKAGDEVLRRAAHLLCQAFPMSAVFRIGGDEFVVLPSGIEYARLEYHLDNLRLMLEEEREASKVLEERVSFSVGCAMFDREKDKSYQEVFERADELMYEEKQKIHARDGINGRER